MLLEKHDYNEILQHYYDEYKESSDFKNDNVLTTNYKLLNNRNYIDEQIKNKLSEFNEEIERFENIYLDDLLTIPFQRNKYKLDNRDSIDWSAKQFMEDFTSITLNSEYFSLLSRIHNSIKKVKRKIEYIVEEGTFISIKHEVETLRDLFNEISNMEIDPIWSHETLKISKISSVDLHHFSLGSITSLYDDLVDLTLRWWALKFLLNFNFESISFIENKRNINLLEMGSQLPEMSAFDLHKRKLMPWLIELLIEENTNPKVLVNYDLYKKDGSLNISGIAGYLKEDNADEIEVSADYIRTDILPKLLDHKEFNHLVRN
ncbi:hypothetical protein DYD21_04005 [Rhodohalobacter sp. SW132]|uniref:hypothetical protein n=1 Tax=Rhodohalobacter sp. SW132 TaxID=2293433 RepID=UPI000E2630BE|nr:hypothetical protein [Rhodohalobacter sp. SW132]REL39128.1 hypothetical protein DYD21_04005 [Rhodohalobacter sp. SW132]